MSLWSLFLNNTGKKIDKWAHYFPAYESHFSRFVDTPILFIEIGVQNGGSLQMWKRYFGPHATIVGIDIDPACKEHEEDQISVRIGDQSDVNFLCSVLEEFGTPDVILDDGSHIMSHVNMSFAYLYPRIAENGVYFVEDMHTSYWEHYDGGLEREGTFIEQSKKMIDELNAECSRSMTPTEFTKSTVSMSFYDSCVVFERGSSTRVSMQTPKGNQ
jgi:hypothetical protein